MLTAGYRMPLNYTVDLIESCKNSLERLYTCRENLDFALSKSEFGTDETLTVKAEEARKKFCTAMDDDLNSPMVISALFDWVRIINQIAEGRQRITAADLAALTATVKRYVFDILGLRDEKAASAGGGRDRVTPLVEMLLRMRMEAKAAKDWATSDRIRDELTAIGIRVKDRKDGFDWEIE